MAGMNWRTAALLLVLAVQGGLGAWYVVAKPLMHAPDENEHFIYVMLVHEKRTLPEMWRPDAEGIGQGHQPPLYYAVLALVHAAVGPTIAPGADAHRAVDDAYRVFRLATLVLFGMSTVILAFALATRLAPDDVPLAFLTASFVAFLPMFLHLSTSIANGMAANALCAAVLLVTVACLQASGPIGWRRAGLLGLLLGLAPLAKVTAAPVVAVCGLAMLPIVWRAQRRGLSLALFALPTIVLVGGWCVRNAVIYGDPLAYGGFQESFRGFSGDFEKGVALKHLPTLWASFVGVFDNHSIPPGLYPSWVYLATAIATGAALLAGATLGRRRPRVAGRTTLLFVAALVATAAFFVVSSLSLAHFQTRYLFVVLPVIAFYVARGALAPFRGTGRAVAAVCFTLVPIVLVVWGGWLL